MNLAVGLIVCPPRHLADPVIETCKNRKYGSEGEHVMEMCDDVISVVQSEIDTRVGQYDAGHASDREQENKAHRPQHRRLEIDGPAPHCRDPRENLHSG